MTLKIVTTIPQQDPAPRTRLLDTDSRLVVAEAEVDQAWRRLKYVRDAALYGHHDAAAFHRASCDYTHAARRVAETRRARDASLSAAPAA